MGDDDRPVNQQLPLLPAGDDGGRGALTAAVGGSRGPGRPPGSPNKRTEAMVEHLLSRYRSPLEALATIYSMPLRDLIEQIGTIWQEYGEREDGLPPVRLSFGQIMQILQMQVNAARELAPYVHQKQPTAIEVDGAGAIPLAIFVTPELAKGMEHALGDGAFNIDANVIESEENQPLSKTAADKLDGKELDGS